MPLVRRPRWCYLALRASCLYLWPIATPRYGSFAFLAKTITTTKPISRQPSPPPPPRQPHPPRPNCPNIYSLSPSNMGSFISQQQQHQRHRRNMVIPTGTQSSATKSDNNDDGDGYDNGNGNKSRPLPDFSAFAYDPAAGTRVPKAEERIESPKTRSGSKRTRPAAKKTAAPTVDKEAKPSAAKKVKKESSSSAAKATTPTKSKSKSTPKKRKSPKKSPSSGGSGRRPRTPKIEPGSLPSPRNWEDTWELVYELRQDRSAPVDTDGGHELPQRDRGDKVYRFQVLVALMLSSQTKDAVVGDTMRKLQDYGLDVENIHRTSAEDLNALINKVGFHNNKTKYLKQTCATLLEKHDGDIPPTAAEMMELPGVGPKMAYIVESIVYNTTTGIGVDTHMHRMFNDMEWVDSKTPEKTREQLEGWLPRDKWPTVNVLWVGIGQETQQQKEKIIRKAIACSRPADALGLIRKLGVDLTKEGKRFGLEEEIRAALTGEGDGKKKK